AYFFTRPPNSSTLSLVTLIVGPETLIAPSTTPSWLNTGAPTHLTPNSFSSLSSAYPLCLISSNSDFSSPKSVIVLLVHFLISLSAHILSTSASSRKANIAFPTEVEYNSDLFPIAEVITLIVLLASTLSVYTISFPSLTTK